MAGDLQEEYAEIIVHTDADGEQGKKAEEEADVFLFAQEKGIQYFQRDIHTEDACGQKAIEAGERKAEYILWVQLFDTIR